MSGTSWTLDKFTTKDNAYSLCSFTGAASFGPILDWAERVSNKCLKSNNFSHITRLVAWTSWTDSRISFKSTNHLKSFVEKFYKCSLTWLAHTKLQDRFTIAALLRTEQGLLLWLFKKQLTEVLISHKSLQLSSVIHKSHYSKLRVSLFQSPKAGDYLILLCIRDWKYFDDMAIYWRINEIWLAP